MNIPAEFDEIRPYTPEELPQVFQELIATPSFQMAMGVAFPQLPFQQFAARMLQCKSSDEFQQVFCKPFLEGLVRQHSAGLLFNRSALTDKRRACTFISNHRDIVLDSAFLSLVLLQNKMRTVEIAIGDNLLIYPWIKQLARVNKSFIVQRALSMREMLNSSLRLSRYIHFAITQKNNPVWIAQREGRAKDSDDRTQESVLKMLVLGGEGTPAERLASLNIVPLSITYEYDPCDYLKAEEFQRKRDNPEFKKSQQDDLTNMQTGMFGYKGHIRYNAAPCINEQLAAIDAGLPKSEWFMAVARLIDRDIHSRYVIYPVNYIAYEEITGDCRFSARYSAQDKEKVEAYFAGQLEKITLPDKDVEFLRRKLLEMYANPLINHIKATR